MKYDVVVVGAGPAGAIAAKYAARNGARTLLIEEHASIGSPVQCTGLISTKALAECEMGEGNFVLARLRGAFVYAPDCSELTVTGKGVKAYVIDRKMFDRALVEGSVDLGADLLLKTRFIDMEKDKVSVRTDGEKKEIQADTIIGCSSKRPMLQKTRDTWRYSPEIMLRQASLHGLCRLRAWRA
ncbi:MAG: FAD-dependent oxidoreductase [Candidatus Methanoperedens sp.]|nr:FAD-dependent oxidoreductase [Candidatus Methanoperedens sp.]